MGDWEIVILDCDVSCFDWMNGNACLNPIYRSEREGEIRREIIREIGGDSMSLGSVIHQIKTCFDLHLVFLKR